MRQKLAFGAVLLATPPLLLLDEPSLGVDPLARRELWELAMRLTRPGTSVVWGTAHFDEAERCARVLILHEGRVLGDGRPEELRAELEGRTFELDASPSEPRRLFLQLWGQPQWAAVAVRGGALRLLGPNGAGKCTFRIWCGLLPPSSGQAQLLGSDPCRAAARARARIGSVAQKFSL